MSTSGGGLVSTCVIIAASTAGGILQNAFQWLDAITRNITGPQATLILGGIGFTLQYGPRVAKWAAAQAAARRARR